MERKITLVRNTHTCADRAESLRPFIEAADVVSFEMAYASEREARYIENAFSLLGDRKKKHEKVGQRMLAEEGNTALEYDLKLHSLLRSYGKPVIFIERHPDDEAPRWKRIRETYHEKENRGMYWFMRGDLDEAIAAEKDQFLFLFNNGLHKRNARIVENGPDCFERACSKSRSKGCNYVVILGNKHEIAHELAQKVGVPVDDVYVPGSPYSHLAVREGVFPYLKRGDVESEAFRALLARFLFSGATTSLLLPDNGVQRFAISSGALQAYQGNPKQIEQLINAIDNYVVRPLGNELAKSASLEDISALSRFLAKEAPERELVGDVFAKALVLFHERFGTPGSLDDCMQWSDFFPRDEARSMDPVITRYNP